MRDYLKIIFLFCLMTPNNNAQGQFVTIPDIEFITYLQQNGFSPCISGNSLDTTCSWVINDVSFIMHNTDIVDLTGIQYFRNLVYLDVSDNDSLSYIPELPPKLEYFGVGSCNFSSLPTLNDSLTTLSCGFNNLPLLPTLPNRLRVLVCSYNPLTFLPPLSDSLRFLSTNQCQLTSLPPLPALMEYMDISFNQIDTIVALPNTLKDISCGRNLLSTLPALPDSLNILSCGGSTNFSSLPTLPNKLFNLGVTGGSLTSLPQLPASLKELDCSHNQITVLPSPVPPGLQKLNCSDNQILNLPSLPSSIISLGCYENLLSTLPPLPQNLQTLNIRDNPNLTCLPQFNFIGSLFFTNTGITCLPNYFNVSSSSPPIFTIPLCDVFNTNGCDVFWNIEGTAFFDADTNCNIGTNESIIKNQKLNLYKNGVIDQQTFTNANGNYDFNTSTYGTYITEFDTLGLPFSIYCPPSLYYLDTISAPDSMKYDRDFGLKCKGVDLAATAIYSVNIRPASVREIKLYAGDFSNNFDAHCATGVGGTIVVTITGACNYFSPAPGATTPSIVTGNVLTYNIADFGILIYDSSFNFNILVDTTAVLGSQICIQVSISTAVPELNYNNNLLSQCFSVVGSFDPNDKSSFPNSTLDINGDRWLSYLIRFQNTGTASAEHIFITDTLSTSLDWSTFNLLSYSHQPLTQVYNDGLVKFSFPNINLPDSNTNEPASHGYVQYKIRAKDSLTIGSTIENTANIFFDFNAPVITNTTSNTVINCLIPLTIINVTICNSQNFELNGVIYSTSGNHVQRFITANGCDSTILLNLTINSSVSYLTGSICIGDTFNFIGQLLTLAGQYSDSLLNSIGCDSIVNLGLSIIPTFTFQTAAICNGSSYSFGGQVLTTAGNFVDSLLNTLGCDSIINLTLQIYPSYFSPLSITTCDFEPYLFDGNLLTQSGIYYDSLQTINGCDSIIELQLNITGITNIITQTSNTLQTQATGSAYVWINCATNQFIFGASGPSYQPFQSGDYAVAVTFGNCIDTSSCFSFSMVGLPSSIAADVIFQTRYNSNSDQIQLHAEKLKGNKGVLRLMDISGRIIFQKQIENIAAGILEIEIPAKGMNAGIYLVNLITERDNVSGKVVKY